MFRVLKYGFLICLLLFIGLVALNLRPLPGPNQPAITVGPTTTYATGPLKPNGDVDYIAWINERLSAGVTPENNAVVDLVRVIGPRPEGADLPRGFYDKLGIAPPPPGAAYIRALYKWEREQGLFVDGLEPQLASLSHDEGTSVFQLVPFDVRKNPSIAEFLEQQAPFLEQMRAASHKSHWYMPMEGDTVVGCLLPFVQQFRAVARDFQVSAMRHLGAGDVDLAMEDCLTLMRLARLAGRQGCLVEMLVASAIEGMATQSAAHIVASGQCSGTQLEAFAEALNALSPPPGIDRRHLEMERAMALDAIANIARGRGDPSIYLAYEAPGSRLPVKGFFGGLTRASIDWDQVCVQFNQQFDRLADLTDENNLEAVQQAIEAFEAELETQETPVGLIGEALGGRGSRSRMVARIGASFYMPAMHRMWQVQWRLAAQQEVLKTTIAVERFRLQHQRLPESLDELVPEFLAVVPQDIWSGQPLVFKPKAGSYQVYSVGPNRKDDGGTSLESSDLSNGDLTGVPAIRTVEDQLRQLRAEGNR